MTFRMKTLIAATALSLGLAAGPASAQVLGVDRGIGYDGRATGYNDDGTLNVFGAHIDPPVRNGGLIGGVGSVVGGVVGGVGGAVGGVVGGATGVADDVVTGSIGARPSRVDAVEGYGRPTGGSAVYGRSTY